MKEQNKTPEEELSEVEMGSLSEKEFRVIIIKMIREFGERIEVQSQELEFLNKELENIKKSKAEMNNN